MCILGNRFVTPLTRRNIIRHAGWLFALIFIWPASAATYYVNIANPVPASPYLTWATAATNIQDAVTVASAGDTVLVTNGIYAYGGIKQGGTSNRVCLNKALTVQSVNGPAASIIQGAGIKTMPMRCGAPG